MPSAHFRAGVVVVVRHPGDGRVLAFERVDTPGSWQLPQGGIQAGESADEAAWRELMEETGLGEDDVIARAEYPDWVAYEWPEELRRRKGGTHHRMGQVQKWFLFDALHDGVTPTPDGVEFSAWQWATVDWLVAQTVEWRRPAYERVLRSL